ncbi:SGNH/GDSL hydrolase family protein [Actinacidiphila yeochonensis]|uniref:SGNH/GDSL hydrolase family protein n=1 Tax=Actinacidiphila yeochonensis TaxID=89050 RepID=UPI000560BAEC|nr:SGNH/GDSL hydrolase family protein [Actinacidiphila yeochonensis]
MRGKTAGHTAGQGSGAGGRGRRAPALGIAALGAALALTAGAVTPAAAGTTGTGLGSHAPGHGSHAPGHPGYGHYTALGDSYTSGPLIPTQVDAACERSDHDYPSLVTAAGAARRLDDVSCGGATTVQMRQAQGANPPQLDAVRRDTDLVTLQIGGNDIGFGSIISTCASLGATAPAGDPCERHYTSGGTDQLAGAVRATAPKVAAVLRAVRERAPHASVVVVGYPDLLPDRGPGCFPTVPFAAGDVAYLRSTEKRLNAMLEAEALLHGARYADTYTPTVGHDMCRPEGVRWIEPLVPAAPAAPAHPNAQGERVMAHVVQERLGSPVLSGW